MPSGRHAGGPGKLPLVSVVIPSYNNANFIEAAIASVRAQDYPLLDIIVVDDGSTDDTRRLVASMNAGVRYLHQRNQGPPAARNLGLRQARGEVVALLDADDLWPPDKLALQLPVLLARPDTGIVLGLTQYFRNGRDGEVLEELPPFFVIQLGCALFRTAVFHKVGFFDEGLLYGDDVDWFLRSREQRITTELIGRATIRYRRHADNMTIAEGHQGPTRTELLKRSLDRRRRTGDLTLAPWPPKPLSLIPDPAAPFWKHREAT